MSSSPPTSPVTLYWRQGCPYCARLRRDLRRVGLATKEVNIWKDPQGAATVRALTGGSETVPTVAIGNVGLVNPSISAVLDALSRIEPSFLPSPQNGELARRLSPLVITQWTMITGIALASILTDASGSTGLSWALDGVGLIVYLGFRTARHRSVSGRRPTSTDSSGS